MPRKDRTFTSKDILRMIGHNLDRTEQFEVLKALGALVDQDEKDFTPKIEAARDKNSLALTRKDLIVLIGRAEELVDLLGKLSSPVDLSKSLLAKAKEALTLTERGTN